MAQHRHVAQHIIRASHGSDPHHAPYVPDGPVDAAGNNYYPAHYRRVQGDYAQAARDWLAHHPDAVASGAIPPWVRMEQAKEAHARATGNLSAPGQGLPPNLNPHPGDGNGLFEPALPLAQSAHAHNAPPGSLLHTLGGGITKPVGGGLPGGDQLPVQPNPVPEPPSGGGGLLPQLNPSLGGAPHGFGPGGAVQPNPQPNPSPGLLGQLFPGGGVPHGFGPGGVVVGGPPLQRIGPTHPIQLAARAAMGGYA